ncbi:hypothetical protein [Proteiniphilum acetatigenes]|uniref:hypothetical protein n=1 Tax=Proteiniphilum acetatigenes TaxID=294710 RepID=UPI0003601373|nr:hypothetical protein [Proteiniphilum acetatigenes]SFL38894.1 hypothetical protein SAMN05216357_12119 [Porphyromonadaceae bacterium KH3CP3RA]
MRQIIITISEIYLDRLNIVAEQLHQEGLLIIKLYEFGVIIGMAEEEVIPKIRDHKEVASLVEEKQVNIPPPDSEIQ